MGQAQEQELEPQYEAPYQPPYEAQSYQPTSRYDEAEPQETESARPAGFQAAMQQQQQMTSVPRSVELAPAVIDTSDLRAFLMRCAAPRALICSPPPSCATDRRRAALARVRSAIPPLLTRHHSLHPSRARAHFAESDLR